MKKLRTILPSHRFTECQRQKIAELAETGIVVDFDDSRSGSIAYGQGANIGDQGAGVIDLSSSDKARISEIVKKVICDPNVQLFLLRRNDGISRKFRSRHALRVQNELINFVHIVYFFHLRKQIDFLILSSTPHSLRNYVETLIYQELGVAVLIIERTFSPKYHSIRVGLSGGGELLPLGGMSANEGEAYENEVADRLNIASGNYCHAIPDYERRRLEVNGGAVFSALVTARKNRFRLGRTLHAVTMWRELKRFSSQSLPEKYVAFFLQYQPERTSLPEAGIFCNQYEAIQMLRRAVPKDTVVLVREHPSTFSNNCDKIWRWSGFYSEIDAIDGVEICDIESNPFDVIDRAQAVATLTGTVGFEARARGVPVVFFGKQFLPDSPGVHRFQTYDRLEKFLSESCARIGDADLGAFQEALCGASAFVYRAKEHSEFDQNTSSVVDALLEISSSEKARQYIFRLCGSEPKVYRG